jgi:hypothetical protein
MGKDWIASATKNKGAFSKKAKTAGMSVSALAKKDTKKKSKVSAKTKKQAVLAQTLAKMRKNK